MKADEWMPVKCPYCGAGIDRKSRKFSVRKYVCGSYGNREDGKVINRCRIQMDLFSKEMQ